MSHLDRAIAFAEQHHQETLNDLKEFLRIPSVSTLPEHEDDMVKAAQWLAEKLSAIGFRAVEVMPTGRHPVVYGEWLDAGPEAPTLLFYGHYDVQPPDPLDRWNSEPFEASIVGQDLYARGASDMKAQILAHLKAVEALIEAGGLPLNLKYMVEGEEEIGSPNLPEFVRNNAELLKCDLCLNGDSGILDPDTPAITYALRGLSYFEVRCYGANTDLHSGRFGGVVDNPALVLCQLLAGMRDSQGRITLPGFYSNVRPLTDSERHDLAELPLDEDWWRKQAGVEILFGEEGFTSTERATARPTLDVNGFYSGFIGEGSKTVLPATAMAKLSMRLVPDQTPEQIHDLLHSYLVENAPPTIRWELEEIASSLPGIAELESSAVRAASRSLEAIWGKRPLFTREGGTIPVVGLVKEVLGVDSLLLGFGLPDDNIHAPNEKQHIPTFFRGIEAHIRFACEVSGHQKD